MNVSGLRTREFNFTSFNNYVAGLLFIVIGWITKGRFINSECFL